jgi:hypothetical protein
MEKTEKSPMMEEIERKKQFQKAGNSNRAGERNESIRRVKGRPRKRERGYICNEYHNYLIKCGILNK